MTTDRRARAGLTEAHIVGPNLRVGAANVEQGVTLMPLYRLFDTRYSVYFRVT